MQTNKDNILLIIFCIFLSVFCHSQEDAKKSLITKSKDSLAQKNTSTTIFNKANKDTIVQDSTITDTLNQKEGRLLDKITYKSKDYVLMDMKKKKVYLYNEAEVTYQDMQLKAGIIVIDYVENEVYAGRIKDSVGNYKQIPFFKQGNNEIEPDSIKFNFNTKRALIWNSKSEQKNLGDGMNVFAKFTKKENDSIYFLRKGKLSTDPTFKDYYITVNRAKFIPEKKVIAGFSNMHIADVPTPIMVPFAYFPMSDTRTSGIVFPTFGEADDRGYFFQNGGYYFVINDYLDFSLLGDFYTNGSYGVRAESTYRKRYKFSGKLSARFENLISGQSGFKDFSKRSNYNIQWSHSQDTKASPNSNFSASVNLGSSTYFRESVNQLNTPNFLNNELASSINYSKTFPAYPSVNMSLTATHRQNTNTERINMTLPSFQASMENIFPFGSKEGTKKGVLQNINFQYNVSADNRIETNDEDFFTSKMFKGAKSGVKHTIPISTNFKIAKYFSVSIGGTYEDVWAFETIKRNNFKEGVGVVTDTISGFSRFNKYNTSVSLGTTIYGTIPFDENSKIQAIRHVIRPSLSWGYTPSFEHTYEEYLDKNGKVKTYSPFEGGIYGRPSLNESNSLNLSVANILEAKIKQVDTTGTIKSKKIKLLNNLSFDTSYVFEADSLKLSPIRMSGSTSILDNKMTINFGANFDPYAIDNKGTRINVLNINNGGGIARITNANANIGYSISNALFNKDKNKESGKDDNSASGGRADDLFGRANDFSDNRNFQNQNREPIKTDVENPTYDTKLPWSLNLNYSITYSNFRREKEISNQSLMFSGNVELSPRWKVGISSGYDFKNKGFTYTQLRFERDLRSWRLNFNWTPFGERRSWYFFIGIKSSILNDIKWDKTKPPRKVL